MKKLVRVLSGPETWRWAEVVVMAIFVLGTAVRFALLATGGGSWIQ